MFLARRDVVQPHKSLVFVLIPGYALAVPQIAEDAPGEQSIGRPDVPNAEVGVDHVKFSEITVGRDLVAGQHELTDDLSRRVRLAMPVGADASAFLLIAPQFLAVGAEARL